MVFDINLRDDDFVKGIYDDSMSELDKFFGLGWNRNKPKVFLVPDRKTIDSLESKKTEDWVVGWGYQTDVYVLDYKNYEKESSHKYSIEEYAALIMHELAHSFIHVITGFSSNVPTWLNEGLAIYLSGQNKFKKKPENLKNFLEYYNQGGMHVYGGSGFAVEFLVKTYGKEKILKVLKSLKGVDTKEKFSELFKKTYGFELKYESFKVL
ncbi:hypothetical protein COU61_01290 [Candidatus Pacearchaeota archaeon CG10_big_fil_rev_8_21_14_0_10_35_13]|nr:MAG: hypothetical protein COU61_01290 [Candidatus Pacearchaeota archaeon CG10_big_fil_rev_8_21_14_0_10_35_13]